MIAMEQVLADMDAQAEMLKQGIATLRKQLTAGNPFRAGYHVEHKPTGRLGVVVGVNPRVQELVQVRLDESPEAVYSFPYMQLRLVSRE